ncbi:hypothetical protein GCM10010399_62660 [Dactylosporangium fulvum]|uniref:Uncharacterized protein n=1 Tax=Dactylosporangium fulvum TaxID=53359 RepID=A0ABY5VZ95_9ACTN|nr:hypothetical protein [Dactylosporangium fulvum]UWP82460.1 hypothetical protein Dfulv_46730 [Dactylosporangium fulvum]
MSAGGGVELAAAFIASAVAQQLVGIAAWEALKAGARHARLRFGWQSEAQQRPYAEAMAQLAVASKLDADVDLDVAECRRLGDQWQAIVIGEGRRYRVLIPVKLREPNEIAVSLELQ